MSGMFQHQIIFLDYKCKILGILFIKIYPHNIMELEECGRLNKLFILSPFCGHWDWWNVKKNRIS